MNIHLRKWKKDYSESLVHLANNKKISDNLRDAFPHPYTLKDAVDWIALNEKNILTTNFAIEVGGQLAGGCGLSIKEDVYHCSAEIGYWVGEPFWGKGVATEAIKQLLKKIQTDFPAVIRIYAEIFEHNKASMRVLEKNGFHLESIRQKAVIKNNILMDDHVWVELVG